MRLILALLLVIAAVTGAVFFKTDGFTVLTSESARRADIARQPRAIPPASLLTAAAPKVNLAEELQRDGRVAVINFIYTRCFSICLAMGSEMQQLQATIQQQGLAGRLRILSLSFDPADTADMLARYATSMKADPAVWQFATLSDPIERKAVLDAFGIVVVPAPLDQYEHNAAFHLVTPDGRLHRIVDLGNAAELLRLARGLQP